MTRRATRKRVPQGFARGEPVACREWLARTCSPDYSQAVCCSGGIIPPDCATRKRVPLPRSPRRTARVRLRGSRSRRGATHSHRRFRRLATTACEESGLGWQNRSHSGKDGAAHRVRVSHRLTPTSPFSASQDPSANVMVFLGRDTSPDKLLTCQPEYENSHCGCQ